MALYLTEADVEATLQPPDAVAAVAAELERDGGSAPAGRLMTGPALVLAGGDAGRELASVTVAGAGRAALVILVDGEGSNVVALVEARRLRALRAAATSAVAARALAVPGGSSLGIIGCGELGRAHVECLRATLPDLRSVTVYCRDPARRSDFADTHEAEAVDYGRDAAESSIVITATTSRDPVLRGDWLRPGALVCAVGATRPEARELDNHVLERAAFVCCDSVDEAKAAAADLVEPVGRGMLDWLEVHELREALAPGFAGRQAGDDVVVLKSVGTAALDLALAALVVERAVAAESL